MRRSLLFDLDGTLVDSAPGIALALSAVLETRAAPPIAADAVRPWVSFGVAALVANALGAAAGKSEDDVAAFRASLRALPGDPAWVYPGVADALERLARMGATMAVVTNKPEGLSRLLLRDIGLLDRFAALVGGDTTPYCKPHRAPLDRALALIGGDACDAAYVGDSAVDAAAAAAVGLPFLLFTGGYGADDCRADQVAGRFDSFADLPASAAALA